MGFPGGANGKESACQCRRSQRHGIDPWAGKMPWKRAWQPTAAFLPGEFHGQRSLVGYSPQVHKELDMTEATEHMQAVQLISPIMKEIWIVSHGSPLTKMLHIILN